ncbi:ABC transporter ATP-binding protein [Agromyces silvae]|uniref:ABC transporter ATP-binding protein n=1 Tax=Agromyces silvae TaxID=3388266 RepID=UPI00280ADB46|nr:ABC transporter ATP-binding protein [Agromyces protaetiae]
MTATHTSSAVLEVRDLVVEYQTGGTVVRALDGANLVVGAGETVGLVGESGSGKSTLGSVIGRLLPGNATYPRGSVHVEGQDVLALDRDEIRALRRDCLGFIPQDPVAALDPTMRVGRQLELALRGLPTARADLVGHLERVRMRDPERVLRLFPHEISGGMAQRVMIAITMARAPRVLVADEPTAALDSNVRGEVTKLIFGLAKDAGTTVLWLSHDLRSVGRWCERVAVMYGGKVVEDGPAARVLGSPTHPYTKALAAADPALAAPGQRIETVGMEVVDIG